MKCFFVCADLSVRSNICYDLSSHFMRIFAGFSTPGTSYSHSDWRGERERRDRARHSRDSRSVGATRPRDRSGRTLQVTKRKMTSSPGLWGKTCRVFRTKSWWSFSCRRERRELWALSVQSGRSSPDRNTPPLWRFNDDWMFLSTF